MSTVIKEQDKLPQQLDRFHALVVPCPLQGHINPMLLFSKALVSRHGFTITFVTNRNMFIHIRQRHPELAAYENLHLQWVEDGLPPDFYVNIDSQWPQFLQACINMQAPLKVLMGRLNRSETALPPVSCVIYGSFFPWAYFAARELRIPAVFFWTQSLAVFSIYYHRHLLVKNGFFPYKRISPDATEEDCDLISYIPGVSPLPYSSFPGFFHVDGPSHPAFQLIEQQFATVTECKAVIFNSFYELEKETFHALQTEHLNTFVVGPVLPSLKYFNNIIQDEENLMKGAGISNADSVSENEGFECLRWLDKQEKQSVLYISFGTLIDPSVDDVEAIALALKAAKQPFLWVLRQKQSKSDLSEILGNIFLEERWDHGLIVAWAPQLKVLGHQAVGAFLTHCGWNSTLESLSTGVPMIPFPDKTDQPTNCNYVVDRWKVGIALKRNSNRKLEPSQVEAVVHKVLWEEDGQEMRSRACKLQHAARNALEEDCGLSVLDIKKFVQAVRGS
ncbi:hypothetical protein KP509_08G039000 [Ceratopteris richardii]|uniref:Glycosyltransferase n=1 Tax=Ceratopteris richardii TaxID=49495 RepID=A0A8T2U7A1_CERRI|nr:hypothetical protein KP509_08G039000 [Ceratopteris richardii]